MGRGIVSYPVPFWLLVPFALVAGAAALIHLLLVTAGLGFEYGASIALQSTIFGCFVGGIALGSLLVGARADASTRPLRWCGLLQIGLAFYAFAMPTMRGLLGESQGLLVTALMLAGIPGLLMGGTIAVLARAGSHTTVRASAAVGVILGSMAIGGALAIPVVAMSGSMAAVVGSVLHGLVGLAAWGVSVRVGARAVFSGTASGAVASDLRPSWTGGGGLSSVFALVALGFALPLGRFAWQRVLPAGGESLLLHLMGLGAGWCLGALLVYTGSNARRVLARGLVAAAILVLVPLLLADGVLRGNTGGMAAMLLIVPGAVGVGLALPLVLRVALSDREAIGKQSGTLIAIFAAAWSITLLLFVSPALGVSGPGGTVFLAGIVLVAAGTWNAFGKGIREWIPAGAAAVLTVVVLLSGGTGLTASRGAALAEQDGRGTLRTIAERVTASTTYDVVEDLETGTRRLFRNGQPDAPAARCVDAYRMIAHLPMLLHDNPERVFVGSFGTGSVAGAVVVHPEVKVLDALDDDDAVFELAGEFTADNRNVVGNPALNRTVGALRRALRAATGKYDVLVFEPRDAAGVRGALFFTEEFYALARGALARDGLLCQRLPSETWGVAALQRGLSAAASAFKSAAVWEFDGGLYLLAGNGTPTLKADVFLTRVSKTARDLQNARVSDPSHLLASYVCPAADFADEAAPLQDGERGDVPCPMSGEWRRQVARRTSRSGPIWAEKIYESLPAAAERCAKLRGLLASDGATSAELYDLASQSRGDLRARAAAESRHYRELMAKNDWAGAARLTWVRDRNAALRHLAASMEDDGRRRFYEILLLRGGGVPDEAALARLASELSGPEQLYVRNRLHSLRGEPTEEGEELKPAIALRDPTDALDRASEEEVRELLLDAECAGLVAQFDKIVWAWWNEHVAKAEAVVMLDAAGWRQSLRAARRVAGQNRPSDLVVLAPLFAAAYPHDVTWERMCEDRRADVRGAAAEAARAHGSRAHVKSLAMLCEDPSRDVRTGAYHSLQGILGEVVGQTGYDPADPKPDSVKRIAALVSEDKLPAAPGK